MICHVSPVGLCETEMLRYLLAPGWHVWCWRNGRHAGRLGLALTGLPDRQVNASMVDDDSIFMVPQCGTGSRQVGVGHLSRDLRPRWDVLQVLQHTVSCVVGWDKRHSEGTGCCFNLSAHLRDYVFCCIFFCGRSRSLAFPLKDCRTNPYPLWRVCKVSGALGASQGEAHSSEHRVW